ncbi:MAG: DUF3137 domain-containing protein [Terricaulis sp.]
MTDQPASEAADLVALDDAGFQRLYDTRIGPAFASHEAARVAGVDKFRSRMIIGFPASLILGALAMLQFDNTGVGFAAAVVGFVITGIYAYAPLSVVKGQVKLASLTALAEAMGVTFTLAAFAPPAFARYRELGLLPGHDRSKFEDLFQGNYKRAAFDLYEAHLEQRHTDSKGRTTWTTAFRGQIVRLGFPRKFLGVTIVRRDAGILNVFGGGKNLERVGLEDPVFEKAFEVFGTDQVEARYLLHPVFMQRLVDLETALKGKKLRCAFEQGDLLIAIEGGNLFEPGDMFKPLADPARARKIVDDIAGVLRVMDSVLTAQAARG